jgi:two-component system chemotaxis response regulator CheY
MKTLVVDDDFVCRLLLQEILKKYGQCHIAVNGRETVAAVRMALEAGEPYDLICLDIMMPEMDGQQALKEIRVLEESRGIISPRWAKIVMTTALSDSASIRAAMREQCNYFLVKPIRKDKLIEALYSLELIDTKQPV